MANPRFIESTAEIQADFELIEPNGAIAVKLREAFEGGMTGLFGFSIDAAALAKPARINGQTVREACKITQVKSVDLIVEPGANGGIIDFIEAMNEEGQTMSEKEKETKEETNVQEAAPAITAQEIDDKIRMVEARANAKATIAASSLPEMAKTRLKKHFETLTDFKEADVETAIKDELDYLAKFTEANVKDLGAGRAAVTKDRLETVSERLDAFFDEGHKDHRQALSFKEAYIDLTGDAKVSGRVENFTEALTSASFGNVLGDAITRRLVKEYNNKTQLDAWRKFASIVPVSDFREQKRVRMGGYGDLAAVSEAAAYAAVTSPTDDVAKYSASKRGGLEKITLEMIKNDDVGAIRQIPVKLARAAKRTLSKFAFNLIVSNPTLGDSKTLFHADHGNLGSDALSAASFTARRLAMMKQKKPVQTKCCPFRPRSCWCRRNWKKRLITCLSATRTTIRSTSRRSNRRLFRFGMQQMLMTGIWLRILPTSPVLKSDFWTVTKNPNCLFRIIRRRAACSRTTKSLTKSAISTAGRSLITAHSKDLS